MEGDDTMSRCVTVFRCKHCGDCFIKDGLSEDLDEALWGHIQMDHGELFEKLQDLETPYMTGIVYEATTALA